MKKNVLAIIAMCIAVSLYAGNIGKACFTGSVRDRKTNELLPGTQIYFPELKTGTAAHSDGSFSICGLPAVKTLVKVSMTGYATITEEIELADTIHKVYYLEISIAEMHEVVITGTSHATELRRNPAPTTVVGQEQLRQTTASNIVDALAATPGVSAVSSGPNIAKPYIRGLGGSRVLVLYDGMRQDGQQWGEEHGVEIDQFMIERVELVKGPASLVYGSDALAGAIHFLPADPLPEGTVKSSATFSGMTNNRQLGASVWTGGNAHGLIWDVRASRKFAANYTNAYDGRVFGTKFAENDAGGRIGLSRAWGYSYIGFNLYDNLQEVPDGARDSLTRKFVKQITEADTLRPIVSDQELSSYAIGTIHQRVQHYRIYSASNFYLGKSKLALRFGMQQSHRREFGHPEHPELPALNLQLGTYTYDVNFRLPEWKNTQTTIGLNGMLQQNRNSTATEFLIPDYRLFDLGPFLFVKSAFGKLDLAFGLRYDTRSFSADALYTTTDPSTGFSMQTAYVANDTNIVEQFTAYAHRFGGWSASGGATFSFNNYYSLKANIARGYRAPNIAEISARGIHPGSGFLQLGESDLRPEFNLQGDAGFFVTLEHFSAGVEFFRSRITDYIYNEKLSSVNGGDSLFVQGNAVYPVFKYHQTSAVLYGGEISFDLHPHPLDWLHFENSLSLLYGENKGTEGLVLTDSTRYLPMIPPLHTSTIVRADLPRTGKYLGGFYIRAGMQFYAAQNRAYLAYGTETVSPAYLLFDAGIGSDVKNAKGRLLFSFDIAASNLANTAYQSNMSRLKYLEDYPVNGTGRSGIYNMGRNISLRITIPVESAKGKETIVPVAD